MNLIYIEWIDSVGCAGGWQELDRSKFMRNPSHITSCGILIHEDDSKIVIASSYTPEDEYQLEITMGQIVIPKQCVVVREDLKKGGMT